MRVNLTPGPSPEREESLYFKMFNYMSFEAYSLSLRRGWG
jgi:hypothetical protein